MKIIVAEKSGFCAGVNHTVKMALETLKEKNNIYSLGEIVHNEYVINNLKEKGLLVNDDINSIPSGSTVIIRAHGESLYTYERAKEKNINIIDLTCGKVKMIHHLIEKEKNTSYIVIIGKKNHPETIAHKSLSNNSFVIENKTDINLFIDEFKKGNYSKIFLVAQTTFNEDIFDELVLILKEKLNTEIVINKTICSATKLRQNEVKNLSLNVDKMIIIGGKNSSNTRELYEISKHNCNNTYLIQNVSDLDNFTFNNSDIIGISAGASTPYKLINDVINYLKENILV